MGVTKETVKRKTIEDMKALGIHKPQYNRVIDVYSGLVSQYEDLLEIFTKGGMIVEVKTADGGVKKAPIVATLENLRKDILAYSDRLCLNPKAIETVTTESKKTSALAEALKRP